VRLMTLALSPMRRYISSRSLVSTGKLSTNAFGMYLVRAADVNGASNSGNSTTNLVSGSEVCIDCVRGLRSFLVEREQTQARTGRHGQDVG
jgi:hypothetical protein